MPDRAQLEQMGAIILALTERRASDPLRLWVPHAKQQAFIDSVLGSECYENWALWANRAGKTDVGAYCGAHLARFGLPDSDIRPSIGSSTVVWDRSTSGWVVALTSGMSRDTVQPKYFDNGFVSGGSHAPFIPDREILGDNKPGTGWRVSDHVLRLKNGSILGFKSVADGRQSFQGAGKDWIHFDEEPEKPIYTESTLRIEAGRRLRIFGTCTLLPPEGQIGGVTWIFTDVAKPILDGKPSTIKIFQASIYDNIHLTREEIASLEAKYPEGSTERRIRLDGELLPGLTGSRAYAAFHYGIHVSEQLGLERRRPLCWTLDFNVSPMVSLVGQRTGRTFRVIRELILEEGSVSEMGQLFRNTYPSHGSELWVFGDSTGKWRDGQTAKSDYHLLLAELRGYGVPIKLRVGETNPRVPDRINAVNRALRDEYGHIGVEIDPSCTELIADLEGVLRDPKGGIKKTYNPDDSYARRTHTSDALGYWIAREQPITAGPLRGSDRIRDNPSSGVSTRMKLPGYTFGRRNALESR